MFRHDGIVAWQEWGTSVKHVHQARAVLPCDQSIASTVLWRCEVRLHRAQLDCQAFSGHHGSAAALGTMRSQSRQVSRSESRAHSSAGGIEEAAATQRRDKGAMDVYAIVSELQEVARNATPPDP